MKDELTKSQQKICDWQIRAETYENVIADLRKMVDGTTRDPNYHVQDEALQIKTLIRQVSAPRAVQQRLTWHLFA